MSERIGFVGLGIMGLAMARNLANAGFELTAFNRTSTKAEEFAEGNQAAGAYSLAELARQSDVVITMLPDPPEVEAVDAGA
jgi:2-hydroxy-3-oxopropionate reductase